VARNSAGDCTIASGVTSLGHNLSSDGTCGLSAPGDLSNVDPQLGPLADNGGPGAPRTLTHALLPGSPAIDAGDNAGCPPSDQRFDERPMDGSGDSVAVCDIGSYEGVYFAQGVPSPASPGPGASPVDLPRSGGHSADGGNRRSPSRLPRSQRHPWSARERSRCASADDGRRGQVAGVRRVSWGTGRTSEPRAT
jgi:hypothetical protein